MQTEDTIQVREGERFDLPPVVTLLPGFISREQFMEIYTRQSGRNLSSMHFYMSFAYFKLTVILHQIY